MATTVKSLGRLEWLQFSKSKFKSRYLGFSIVLAYFWIAEITVFVVLRMDGTSIPAIAATILPLFCIVPDFIMKLVFVKDCTVMDPFLKTRPIDREVWERFLVLSQFWKPFNLLMPLMLAPACFLFLPFLNGLWVVAVLYLASVLGGFLVMQIKRKGTYQPESAVKNHRANAVKSVKGSYITGIQLRSFLRSKKLRGALVYLAVFTYLEYMIQSKSDVHMCLIYAFLFVFVFACTIPQYGFAIEANFFNGIWTRPIPIEKLLEKKYRFGQVSSVIALLLCLPACIWSDVSVLDLFSLTIFVCCFGNLAMLFNAYNCEPFDLFDNSFFNKQGRSSNFRASSMLVLLIVFGIGAGSIYLLSGWKFQVLLSALGIAGFCAYKPFFRWVVRRFMANRYKIMENYMSK